MAGISPTAASAVQDRVIVPVVADPAALGIILAGTESGFTEVRSIEATSQLKDAVVVGDYVDRINDTPVRGLKTNVIGYILKECIENNSQFTICFLRKQQGAAAATSSKETTRAVESELITPPAKRLKETPVNPQETLVPAVATATPTPQAKATTTPQTCSRHVKAIELRQLISDDRTSRSRPYVKETLARAYELHISSRMMKEMLEKDENAKKNACLVEHFEETIRNMQKESQAILDIPEDLFHAWELHFLHLIKYTINTGETSVKKCKGDDKLNKWMQVQRQKRNRLENGNKEGLGKRGVQALQEEIAVLNRIGFAWKGRETKSFDDYFLELQAYKEMHGNVKVPKLLPDSNLGEWVSRMRREYDDFSKGMKVAALNPERIAALNELGMIWKIRHGRPRKGDARFRLRRKSASGSDISGKEDAEERVIGDSPVMQEAASVGRDEAKGKLRASEAATAAAASSATQGSSISERDVTDLDREISGSTWL